MLSLLCHDRLYKRMSFCNGRHDAAAALQLAHVKGCDVQQHTRYGAGIPNPYRVKPPREVGDAVRNSQRRGSPVKGVLEEGLCVGQAALSTGQPPLEANNISVRDGQARCNSCQALLGGCQMLLSDRQRPFSSSQAPLVVLYSVQCKSGSGQAASRTSRVPKGQRGSKTWLSMGTTDLRPATSIVSVIQSHMG